MPKKTVEQEVNDFMDVWHQEDMIAFFNEVMPLIMAYNVDLDKEEEQAKIALDPADRRPVMVVRTAYHMVKLAEKFAGKFVAMKIQFKGLPKRMEEVK